MGYKRLVVYFSYLIILITLSIGKVVAYQEEFYDAQEGRISVNDNNASSSSSDLADTIRIDPLENFEKYRGGFDITNKHYWSSTAFTGIYGYTIGVAWLLCGVLFGAYLLVVTFCCRSRRNDKLKKMRPCSRQCYLWPIVLGTLFTILAIIVSGVVFAGTTKFHSRAKTVMDIIIDTTDGASNTIYNVTGAMRDISSNIAMTGEGWETPNFLTSTSQRLDVDAAELSRQARKNRNLVDKGLNIVFITTMVVISINLVAAIALSVCGVLKLRKALYTLLIFCWLLAALCWIFFGLYFFLNKFSSDTCTALEDFQQNPHNNSLSSIVPCDELFSAQSVLVDTKVGIFNLINEINQNITTVQASIGVNLVQICNPFSAPPEYNYQPENCPANTIQIGDIPQVLRAFTCSSNDTANCSQGQFISDSEFRTVEAVTTSVQKLLNAFPGMESLVDCQIVKDAFTEILSKHCMPVKKYVKMVWASLIVLSTIMVALVLIWAVRFFRDGSRHFSDGSINPHMGASYTVDFDEKNGGKEENNYKLDP